MYSDMQFANTFSFLCKFFLCAQRAKTPRSGQNRATSKTGVYLLV